MRRGSLKMLQTLDVRSRAIDSKRRRRKFHRGRVIVATRKSKEELATDEHGFFFYSVFIRGNPWLKRAASGSPFAARFSQSLKIVVKHSSMTNQTHLFRQFHGSRPDQGATPRASNVIPNVFNTTILRIDLLIQFDLP
jgi:hypothetical protein